MKMSASLASILPRSGCVLLLSLALSIACEQKAAQANSEATPGPSVQKARTANVTAAEETSEALSCHAPGSPEVDTKSAESAAVLRKVKVNEKLEQGRVMSPRVREKLKVYNYEDFLIDGVYPSMTGPYSVATQSLDAKRVESKVWITSYAVEVKDPSGKYPASQEYLCHTNLRFARLDLASISQGQMRMDFPKGFGIPITTGRRLSLSFQVLNMNNKDINQTFDFKTTVGYLENKDAKELGLKALYISGISMECGHRTRISGNNCVLLNSVARRGLHWSVPPGRQTLRIDVYPQQFLRMARLPDVFGQKQRHLAYEPVTLHYIRMHVHPYAESMELRDKTLNKRIWKGYAENHPNGAAITSTDHYSSVEGHLIYPDHVYELVSTYNNTTDQTVDAMAMLWIYIVPTRQKPGDTPESWGLASD